MSELRCLSFSEYGEFAPGGDGFFEPLLALAELRHLTLATSRLTDATLPRLGALRNLRYLAVNNWQRFGYRVVEGLWRALPGCVFESWTPPAPQPTPPAPPPPNGGDQDGIPF